MKQLSENKATGVIPGDSDFYFIADKIHFIELKLSATQSDQQHFFEKLVTRFGHNYYIIKSLESFDLLIKSIIENE